MSYFLSEWDFELRVTIARWKHPAAFGANLSEINSLSQKAHSDNTDL